MSQIKIDAGSGRLMLDKSEVMKSRRCSRKVKAPLDSQRWVALCKEGQEPSEAISAIAAGEGNQIIQTRKA